MKTQKTCLDNRLSMFRFSSSALVLGTLLLAVVTGCSSNSTAVNTAAAAPAITSVSPGSVPVGSFGFTLSVTGSGFVPKSVVAWENTPLPTTYTSPTALTAMVSADLALTGKNVSITVVNPDGQNSSTVSGSAPITISIANPLPVLTAVSPALLIAGAADTTFTLTGSNFTASSTVNFGNVPFSTTFVSSTQLTVSVTAANLAQAGNVAVTVSNPLPGGGNSQSVPVVLYPQVPTLTTLSPDTETVGTASTIITISGRNFTPTSLAYINGYRPFPTTFVSSQAIQVSLDSSYLSSTRTLTFTVQDPASGSMPSNSLALQVINPVPVLSSISPATITAGAPNFALTLTGANFAAQSTVLINGVSHLGSTYPTGGPITITVAAAEVENVGDLNVTVVNPTPGGGTSATQKLHVISANNRLRTLNYPAFDLKWDPTHSLLYASISSSASTNANSIIAIDPLQGTVVTSQVMSNQPERLAISDDGSYLYVSLPASGQIARLTLPSLQPDITFSLGNDTNNLAYEAEDLEVAPGQPHTLGVTRYHQGYGQGATGGLVIYDDGAPRAAVAVARFGARTYDTIAWGTDASIIYGTDGTGSGGPEFTFAVDATGVSLTSTHLGALGDFVGQLAYDKTSGLLFDGYGSAVNALTGQLTGSFSVQNTINYEQNPFAFDAVQRKMYFLNTNPFFPSNPPSGEEIQVFDADTFSYVNSLRVTNLSGSRLVRWGASGLAVGGGAQIDILDGSFVAPTGITSPAGSYVAPAPTVTSITPAAVPAGSADVVATLSGRDFSDSATVTWNNQTLPINTVTDTQLTVTIPASMLTQAVASAVTVSNGPGSAISNGLGFSVLPDLGANTQISAVNVSGQDVVWDAKKSLLYIAVPDSDPAYSNSIAVVDPVRAVLQSVVPAGDQPSVLAISDDSQYLYAGFKGTAVVQRFTLPVFARDLTIPLGAGVSTTFVSPGTRDSCSFAVGLKVAPANPRTIAVSQGVSNQGCGALAIFDDATARPDTTVGGDFTSITWGRDATAIYAQSFVGGTPQNFDALMATSFGVSIKATAAAISGLGMRPHYDSGTNLIYSDYGRITNPVDASAVGSFGPILGMMVPDSALNRAFFLVQTPNQNNYGLSTTSYTLQIYDLANQALLKSIVIPDVLGVPLQLVRWGTNGIAFVTQGQQYTSGSAGMLYLIHGSDISGVTTP
jgi:hypothetical protein